MGGLLITAALPTALGTTSAALRAGPASVSEKVLGAADIARQYTTTVTKPADVAVVAKATASAMALRQLGRIDQTASNEQ